MQMAYLTGFMAVSVNVCCSPGFGIDFSQSLCWVTLTQDVSQPFGPTQPGHPSAGGCTEVVHNITHVIGTSVILTRQSSP